MSEVTQQPTHYRLLNVLKAIGPYLREPQSEEGHYIFDCLSVCVNDKNHQKNVSFGAGGWNWISRKRDIRRSTISVSTTLMVTGILCRYLKKRSLRSLELKKPSTKSWLMNFKVSLKSVSN